MSIDLPAIRLLVNSNHGINVPKVFVEKYDLSLWSGINPEDAAVLRQGPDAEHYWETWDDVLSGAEFRQGGHTWTLWQDGDLWAICDALMTDEEYENFFGEKRS